MAATNQLQIAERQGFDSYRISQTINDPTMLVSPADGKIELQITSRSTGVFLKLSIKDARALQEAILREIQCIANV